MPYQQAIFANEQYYHIFNRGVEKRITFTNKRDFERFIETIDFYRMENPPSRFSFKNRPIILKKELKNEYIVEIICFCLMPNHFHILAKQLKEEGITKFASQISNSYTKYFNIKYKRVGPLFQGSFKAVRIENDEQLLHVSRYIHLNPLIDYLIKDLSNYKHSSYPEFIKNSNGFCKKNVILSNFPKPFAYKQFVLDQEDYGRSIKLIERQLLDGKE